MKLNSFALFDVDGAASAVLESTDDDDGCAWLEFVEELVVMVLLPVVLQTANSQASLA